MSLRRRPPTQRERAERGAANKAVVDAVLAEAARRGWRGCGDLVDRTLRQTPAFKLLPDETRFALSYVVNTESGCWEWVGSKKTAGYGQIRFRRKNANAHRVSYETHVGPIADGLTIDHLCQNKSCVNPEHLEPVTVAENTQRWAATITACPQGHPRSPRQHQCRECKKEPGQRRSARETVARLAAGGEQKVKLSDDDIESMRRLRADGMRVADVAKVFGVTAKYASAVIAGSRQRRQRYTGPTKSALHLVAVRSADRCEFVRCGDLGAHTHHRRPRRLGGSREAGTNLPSNLVRLCVEHHELVESDRSRALEMGLLLHANDDPAAVPVELAVGLVWLTADGRYAHDDPGVAG